MARLIDKLLPRTATSRMIVLTAVFLAVIASVLILGIRLSETARKKAQDNLAQQFQAPQEAVKSQVKRVLYKRVNNNGETEYIEILPNGQVNLYDADFNLLKAGLEGFTRINNLFDELNRNLDQYDQNTTGNNSLTIETNQGTIIINFDDPDDLLDDIIDEIEDIVDDTFTPTPTPLPPTPTITPGGPTLTPTPTLFIPSPTPTTVIGGPTPTPTPLPGYMTAPPFTCEDYDHLNRPITISNVICGAD